MKRIACTFFSCLLLFFLITQKTLANWTVSPEPQKVFIENKSQFDRCLLYTEGISNSEKILFATDGSNSQILFTKKGLIYRFEKRERKLQDEAGEEEGMNYEEREKKEHEMAIETDFVKMEWDNASTDVEITGLNEMKHYYNYASVGNSTIRATAFEKLLYKNLYPMIDVEYTFHPQTGIEYRFILHPGADASLIKMNYSHTAAISFDGENNLHFATKFGDIVDHAPHSFYAGAENSPVASAFKQSGNVVSFELSYDHTKETIIDPWTVTPSMPNGNVVYYIKADASGNVYTYGGDSPFRLVKYDSAGVLQWIYNTPWGPTDWFGALAVDKSGSSYITDGSDAALMKVDSTGTLIWSKKPSSDISLIFEYWALDFDCDQTELYIGGTRSSPFSYDFYGVIFKMDMNNGTVLDYINVAGNHPFPPGDFPHEVRSLCTGPDGNVYFLSRDTVGSLSPQMNVNFEDSSRYHFPYYLPYSSDTTGQGQNNIRATSQYVYTTDGEKIEKRNISTGAVLISALIPNGLMYNNSGVAIDSCGSVYVGSQTQVHKYDENLNLLISATTSEPVYDVSVTGNGNVLACGHNFISSINMSACVPYSFCPPVLKTAITSSMITCDSLLCNGTAAANAVNGTPPFSFLWSNGQTTSTISGLCPGHYSVTITDGTGNSASAATNVFRLGTISPSSTVYSSTCGMSTGSIHASASGGVSPYSYLWNTGANTATISNLSPGIYSVIIRDSTGCLATDTFVVYGTITGTISINASQTSICPYDSAQVCAPNGYMTYKWNSGESTPCIYAKGARYCSVTVTDANFCSVSSNQIQILTFPAPTASITVSGDTLTANTAQTYQWYLNGSVIAGANSNMYIVTQSGSYSVAVTDNNGCTAISDTVMISACRAYYILYPDTITPHNWWAINQATGAAPLTYLWNWGDGGTATGAFPTHYYSAPGNYNICLTITDANTCSSTYCDSSTYVYKAESIVTINVVSQIPTSITDNSTLRIAFVYPNPAYTELNINLSGRQAERVRIYNPSGQLVSEASYPAANRISIESLVAGVYIAEVKLSGEILRLRWVKM